MLLLLIKSLSKKFNKNSSLFLQTFCKISLRLRGIHHEVIFCQIIKSLHQNVRPRNIKSQNTTSYGNETRELFRQNMRATLGGWYSDKKGISYSSELKTFGQPTSVGLFRKGHKTF